MVSPLFDLFVDDVLMPAYRSIIPDKNLWAWADADNVYLDARATREPGYFRSRKTPHNRQFMETWTDPYWREDLVMKSSRSGVTEAALCGLRFMPQHMPGNALFAIDSNKEIKAISKDRLLPTLQSAAGDEWPEDPDDSGIYNVFLRNMTLWLSGSYSPGIWRNKWLRVAVVDECEVKSEIDEEGSTLDLAESRLKTEAGDGKLFAMSKAKKKDTAFHKRWCKGTRSVRLVPCPCCGTHQELTFFGESSTDAMKPDPKPGEPPIASWPAAQRLGRVRFDHCKDLTGEYDKERVRIDTYYECVNGCRIDMNAPFTRAMLDDPVVGPSFDNDFTEVPHEVRELMDEGIQLAVKNAMMLSGHWLATNPKPHPRRRSRHISDLYSQYDDLGIGELALIWIDAQGDIVAIQHFINNNLGLVFAQKHSTVDESLVLELRADYDRGTCPFVPDMVLINFDSQLHYLAAIITAWLVDGTCAIIDWFDAVADEDIIKRFDLEIAMALKLVHPQKLSGSLPLYVKPQYGMGDAAGAKGRTDEIYDLCLKMPGRLYPSFGRGGLQVTTPIAQSFVEWRFQKLPIYRFSDDTFKRGLYCDRIARIRDIKKAQAEGKDPVLFGLPPRLYAPRNADSKLVTELAGERQLPDGSWQDPAPGPNHTGDALKNALVQFEFLRPRLLASKRIEADERAKAAAAAQASLPR